jgi:plastocyanin
MKTDYRAGIGRFKQTAAIVLSFLLVLISGAACQGPAASSTTATRGPDTSAKVDVNIVDFSFQPGTTTIAAGITVVWHNNDAVTHTVNARDKSFDSGSIAPGATYAFTFPKAGSFEYSCGLHPAMVGKVIVQ